MPLLTLTVPSSLPETCCFLRPKFTLLERGEGRREGRGDTESHWKSGQTGGDHPEGIMPGCRVKKCLLYYDIHDLYKTSPWRDARDYTITGYVATTSRQDSQHRKLLRTLLSLALEVGLGLGGSVQTSFVFWGVLHYVIQSVLFPTWNFLYMHETKHRPTYVLYCSLCSLFIMRALSLQRFDKEHLGDSTHRRCEAKCGCVFVQQLFGFISPGYVCVLMWHLSR